jgi:hypothetical protein
MRRRTFRNESCVFLGNSKCFKRDACGPYSGAPLWDTSDVGLRIGWPRGENPLPQKVGYRKVYRSLSFAANRATHSSRRIETRFPGCGRMVGYSSFSIPSPVFEVISVLAVICPKRRVFFQMSVSSLAIMHQLACRPGLSSLVHRTGVVHCRGAFQYRFAKPSY